MTRVLEKTLRGFAPLREFFPPQPRVAMSAAVVTSATDSCILPELSMRLSVLAAAVYAATLPLSVQAQDMTAPTYPETQRGDVVETLFGDRKSTRLNSSHVRISYAVFCLKKKKK